MLTDDQVKLIRTRLETLEDQVDDVHSFFFKPPVEGQETRVVQIDNLLFAARAGKATVRTILWAASAITVIAAAVAVLVNTV